jgi:hypothetical protein
VRQALNLFMPQGELQSRPQAEALVAETLVRDWPQLFRPMGGETWADQPRASR